MKNKAEHEHALSVKWIIRSFGEYHTDLPSIHPEIHIIEYTNWTSFLIDSVQLSTSFLIYNSASIPSNSIIENNRARKIIEICNKQGLLWAKIETRSELNGKSFRNIPDACLVVISTNELDVLNEVLNNAFEISTYAERTLLNGALVSRSNQRQLIQYLHRQWRLDFSCYQKELTGLSSNTDIVVENGTKMTLSLFNSVLRNTTEVALANGYSYEELNSLFIKYGNINITESIQHVFSHWIGCHFQDKLRIRLM